MQNSHVCQSILRFAVQAEQSGKADAYARAFAVAAARDLDAAALIISQAAVRRALGLILLIHRKMSHVVATQTQNEHPAELHGRR